MVRRYAVGTAAGAALALSLAGCAGAGTNTAGGTNVSAVQAIDLASKKTSTVTSYKVDLTVGGTGQAVSKAHGAIQVRLRPDVAAIGTLDEATVHGMSLPSGERAILLGDSLYAKVPSQLTQFAGGKPWVRFSLSHAGQQGGVDVDQLLKQANPADQTKIFTGAKDVRTVGTERIDGVKTTHYRGTLTPQEAATVLDPKARQSFQDFYQRSGAHNVDFDLWVDHGHLPRKLVTKVAASQGSATMTLVFSGYNKSFSVSAPPASEVADGDQLKNSFGGNSPKLPG